MAVVGLNWSALKGAGSPVWPAAGVALAGLLLGGVRLWPAIFVGRLAAGFTVGSTQGLFADSLIAGGNTLAAVLPVLAIRRWGHVDFRLTRMRDVLWVAALGAATSAVIAAGIGTATLIATGALLPDQFTDVLLGWFLGNLVGGLTIATLILSWASQQALSEARAWLHFAACMLLVALLSYFVFIAPGMLWVRTWHLYPALVWAALAFQVRGASAAMVIASAFAIWGVGEAGDAFLEVSSVPSERLLLAQQFAAISSIVTLILAAVADERRGKEEVQEARARLDDLNRSLELQVRERTRERDRIWELSQDVLAVGDFDGRILAANPAWSRLLGWSREELAHLSYVDFVHPEDLHATETTLAHLRDGQSVVNFENRIRSVDGSYRWFEWQVVPEEGLIYAIGRDVTDPKARQAELEATHEQLRQSQKMDAMGQLTGGVAHDFNNLLTPIIGFLDVLRRRLEGDEHARRMIDAAMASAERARTLVQRLLAFARRQPLQPHAVDVREVLSGMRELLASTCGPRIVVRLEVSPDLPPIHADRNQLEMAILNLAVNARDAMPNGGTLTLAAELGRPRPSSGLPPRDHVKISISDTGIGMDAKTAQRAVEPFFSTKGIGKGTGLGLSMVHGLMGQLGGALIINSRKGVGTSIELWLPLSTSAVATAGARPRVRPRGKGLVLLVDDEELARASTAELLVGLGYHVEVAESAEKALELLESGLEPDLIATDHLMPGMTGEELATELRNRNWEVPVLVISGYADVDGIDPTLPRLVKPFREAELAEALGRLPGRRSTSPTLSVSS